MSYAKNPYTGSAEVLDRNDYYPFGMNFVGTGYYSVYDATGTPYNYKYNQKELQETGMYDYGWRQYMPDIGKWNGMDQLSEMYQSFSPYAYVVNNPTMLTDPDGRWINENGNMSDRSGQTSFLHGQSYQPLLSMGNNGMMSNPLYQYYSATSSGATFTGANAGSIFNYLRDGGAVSFKNGYMSWWTNAPGVDTMEIIGNDEADIRMYGVIQNKVKVSQSGGNYWSFLNDASSVQAKTDFAIGSTLGLADQIAGDLLNSGKMIKASNPFNLYNLRRVNGALNGNRYISANKFISRARMLRYVSDSKVVKGVSYAGLFLSFEQFRQSHHPGYISRGIVGFLAGDIPYVGPAIAMGIDQTNVDYWNIWTMVDEIQGTHKYDNY